MHWIIFGLDTRAATSRSAGGGCCDEGKVAQGFRPVKREIPAPDEAVIVEELEL